jgi:hypothetical protein
MKKFDSLLIGTISGLILPFITITVYYFIKYNKVSVSDFINVLETYNVITQVISLCVLPNLLLFFINLWTNRMQSARGVILATFIYTFIVLIMKNV